MYIWSIVFKKSYYEYFLPNVNNRAITEKISAEDSGLAREILLSAEVWDGQWQILENEYIFFDSREPKITLSDGLLVKCTVRTTGEKFAIVVSTAAREYSSFEKYYLPKTGLKIGRETDNHISFNTQNLISSLHATLEISGGKCYLADHSRNGVFVDGARVAAGTRHPLSFGNIISIFGLKIVWLGDIIAINRPTESMAISPLLTPYAAPETSGVRVSAPDSFFQRSPRTITPLDTETIAIDSPPAPSQSRRQPLLLTIGPAMTMVIPMTAGILFMLWGTQQAGGTPSPFIFMGIITAGAAAMLGVLWGLTNYRHAKRMELEAEEKRKVAYKAYLQRMTELLDYKHARNRATLEKMYPPVKTCFTYTSPGVLRLWERNVNHTDFLTARLGIGAIPSPNAVETGKEGFALVEDELAEEPRRIKIKYEKLQAAPVCINLLEHRLVGIIGNAASCAKIGRIITAQLAACHSYSDLRMAYLYNADCAGEYAFARWLPHTWSEYGDLRMVACEKVGVDEVIYDLSTTLRKRIESAEGPEQHKKSQGHPHYVVFVTDPRILENEPLAKILYEPQEGIGLSVILLYEEIGQIPNSCTVIIRSDHEYNGYYSLDGVFDDYMDIKFDSVPKAALEDFARKLSDKRLREAKMSGEIPEKLTYLEMLGAAHPKDIDVYRHWLENRTYESMRAIIGYRNADTPIYLDVHEKAHGPHGLVAGTTGSGKSETLQTYILSLVTHYHPHEVSFILIDYKGGGMAQCFEGLPHVSGIITNLGGNATNRALAAIDSESKRRQREFSSRGIKHIDEYIELYRGDAKTHPPMPHLLIIADEFAELKKEQGDFVHKLVSVARVGRSLGIHLILATQKPSSSVDDEIQSNSRFRLCLRVQDRQDSMDMIRRPDAAEITVPGRGYFQVGNNELFEYFQSGWSGAPYDPEAADADNSDADGDIRIINLWGKRRQGTKRKIAYVSPSATTQLAAMVEHICNITAEKHIEPTKSIWLEPLPNRWILPKDADKGDSVKAYVGFADDPKGQRQFPISIDLISTGHMIVAGSTGSGKTTFLQTMLYSLATRYTPEEFNAYIIDMGSRGLQNFSLLPHVGGVAFDTDQDKVDKLIALMSKEIVRRKDIFAEKGIGTFREHRQEYGDLPAILFVIDNYPAFIENFARHEDIMISLSREAASFGIYLAISCMEAGNIRRMRQNFTFGVGLQLADRFKYEDALGAGRLDFMPDDGIEGRGLIRSDSDVLEFQAALCVDEPTAARINANIRGRFEKIRDDWNKAGAPSIPQVPGDMSVGHIMSMPYVADKTAGGRFMPLGFDRIEATPVFIDLGEAFCYTVSGGKRKGKTSLLKALAAVAKKQNADCYIFDGPSQELKTFADAKGLPYITAVKELDAFTLDMLRPECISRNEAKGAFMRGGQQDLDGYLASRQKICLFINDMDAFCRTIYASEKGIKDFIEEMFARGEKHLVYIFACINSSDVTGEFSHVVRKFTDRKEGIHLGGDLDGSQRIFTFDDVPGMERAKSLPAGMGHSTEHGITKRIIVLKGEA
jgi:S-DNA-T family DNA segregation ATPase FtsK/SpoIIIE